MPVDWTPCTDECHSDLRGPPARAVFVTNSLPFKCVEDWVRTVAWCSGQRMDWFVMGGRDVVKSLGNPGQARLWCLRLLPLHDAMYREYAASQGWEPPRTFQEIPGALVMDDNQFLGRSQFPYLIKTLNVV